MRFVFRTLVQQSPSEVMSGFDERLFKALAPPFPPLQLLRFDGCKKGDRVELRLWSLVWVDWFAEVIEAGTETDGTHYFIDTGVKLPYFLTAWQHVHRIEPKEGGSEIIDDIRFSVPWFGFVFIPFVALQFWMRKPVYARFFAKN